MQNLNDVVVAYLMALLQIQRSESVGCDGELIMNAYRYTGRAACQCGAVVTSNF